MARVGQSSVSHLPCVKYAHAVQTVKIPGSDRYAKYYKDADTDKVSEVIAPETLLMWFDIKAGSVQRTTFNAIVEIIIRNGGYVETKAADAWKCLSDIMEGYSPRSLYMRIYRLLAAARERKSPFWDELFEHTTHRIDVPIFLTKCAMKIFELNE